AGQQPLGEGGDEDHRNVRTGQDVLHRVDAGRAVGELDVGEHQAGGLAGDRVHRLGAGGGDVDHRVPDLGDQGLDVGGDDRLVLDDEHLGRQFGVDLGLGLGDQALDLGKLDPKDL